MNERPEHSFDRNDFEPKRAASWRGERVAHPGYMQRRRAAILAEHPEYAAACNVTLHPEDYRNDEEES